MAIEISSNELTVLHTSVERLAGTVAAVIGHFQREGAKDLADLHQLAVEDIVRLREFLMSKGVARPLSIGITAPPIAPGITPAPLVLPPDHLENMARFIEGAEANQ